MLSLSKHERAGYNRPLSPSFDKLRAGFDTLRASGVFNTLPLTTSYLFMLFWITAFAGMTMLTAFNDYGTVLGGGDESSASRFIDRSC